MSAQRTPPQRVHLNALFLMLILLSVAMLAQERAVIALKENIALVRTTANLVGNAKPLSVNELVVAMQRPTFNKCKSMLADLQHLATEHPAPRLFRTLGISLVLCGQPEQAERTLRFAGTDSLSLMAMAISIAQQGKPADALAVLRQVPRSAAMLAAGGESAYWGHRDEALGLLEMSLAIDGSPKRSKAPMYQHLSLLHEGKNHPDEAIRYAQLWVDVAPEDYNSSMLLAGLYVRRGRAEDAYIVLQRAEALGAWSHPLFPGLMGRVYDLRGDVERAIPLYREAVVRNPDDPFIQFYLGQALYRHGDYQESMVHLEFAAKSIYPTLQQAAENLLARIHKEMDKGNQ